MIAPATASQIGGVKLNGVLGSGTADAPVPPDGFITSVMLQDAYALASALTTETNRAEAAEASIAAANNASYQAAITYMNQGITSESNARVAALAAIQSTLNVLAAETSATSANVGTFYATLNASITAEVNNRANADSTLNSAIGAVNTALTNEITRAQGAENACLVAARNFADLTNIVAARLNLGLGSAALESATAFDPYGAAAAVNALLNAEIDRAEETEASKLSKAANLSDIENAATARSNLELGSASTLSTSAFDAAGTSATEQARALAAEALLAPLSNTVTLSGSQTVVGNKNFTGGLSVGGEAVVTTTDSRLSDARNPLAGSVTASSVANGSLMSAQLSASAGVLATQLAAAVQTSLALANTSVQSVNSHTGTSVTLTAGDVEAIGIGLYTAKGDILAAGGANDPVHVSVGADGTVLTADATSSLGVSWKTSVKRFDTTIGDGTTTVFPIEHSLGQQYVMVQAFTISTGAPIAFTYVTNSVNLATVTISPAPASNAVHIAIIG